MVSLAQQMYDTREFSAMPILADALQDASCDNETILTHCRSETVHTCGCFAIEVWRGDLKGERYVCDGEEIVA